MSQSQIDNWGIAAKAMLFAGLVGIALSLKTGEATQPERTPDQPNDPKPVQPQPKPKPCPGPR